MRCFSIPATVIIKLNYIVIADCFKKFFPDYFINIYFGNWCNSNSF